MTGELLESGIGALKDINNIIMNFCERSEENNHDVAVIQKDLEILTDVLHQAFLDMVEVNTMREKIKVMNDTIERHLEMFSAEE